MAYALHPDKHIALTYEFGPAAKASGKKSRPATKPRNHLKMHHTDPSAGSGLIQALAYALGSQQLKAAKRGH